MNFQLFWYVFTGKLGKIVESEAKVITQDIWMMSNSVRLTWNFLNKYDTWEISRIGNILEIGKYKHLS